MVLVYICKYAEDTTTSADEAISSSNGTSPIIIRALIPQYADPSNSEARGLVPHPVEIVTFSSLWLVPAYLFISGVEHMSYLVFPKTSLWYLERNQNPFRWTEYTFSAPFMKVVVAQQVGVTDVHLLVIIFVLMAVSIQCAATHEAVNAKARSENRPQNWRPFFVGWLGHLTGWSFIFSYLFTLTSRGGASAALWIIVVMQLILDSGFPVLFTMQWLKIGPFEDYVEGEKAFIVLSFVNKTLLAWLSLINAGVN